MINIKNIDKKSFVNIIIIVLVVTLIGVVGILYLVKTLEPVVNQFAPDSAILENLSSSTSKFILEEDEIADWKIYRNEEFGFEFKYPTNSIFGELKIEFPVFGIADDVYENTLKIYFGDSLNLINLILSEDLLKESGQNYIEERGLFGPIIEKYENKNCYEKDVKCEIINQIPVQSFYLLRGGYDKYTQYYKRYIIKNIKNENSNLFNDIIVDLSIDNLYYEKCGAWAKDWNQLLIPVEIIREDRKITKLEKELTEGNGPSCLQNYVNLFDQIISTFKFINNN